MMIEDAPRARADVVFRPLADEWVLFDPDRHLLHVLNHTAALVWTSCDGEHSIAEIVADVAAAFDEPPSREQVERDVRQAVERFHTEGLFG